jgi:FKBP-type peptidyl-prolyl cis-trans isomerase SlyD
MKITKDKVVSLTYELRLNQSDGDIIESLTAESPLTFLYGSGNLLPKFEENISGLTAGEQFIFDIKASEAYGEFNNDAVVDVPISAFEKDGQIDEQLLKTGTQIPMQDSAGNRLTGVVKAVNEKNVTMDFNHPLAGQHLYFKGEITEIREATEEELHHGHAHYPGSCEGCDHCEGEGGHC